MIKLRLKDISKVVNRYAKVISSIVNIDVEIVDENLIRIAGTGLYSNKVNESIDKVGYVYKHALATGEIQIINNPGENELCKNCEQCGNCIEEMEICVPIKYKDETFGIIGLICSSYDQKKRLEGNLTNMVSFLEQIGELIAAKIIEENEVELSRLNLSFLKQILDSVDNGVIPIKRDGTIQNINYCGLKELKLSPSVIGKNIEITEVEEYYHGNRTFKITIEEKEFNVVGKLIPNVVGIDECDKILIFNKLHKLQEDALNISLGDNKTNTKSILGESKAIKSLKNKVKRIADSKSTVLITGESGTGKELVARAIHSESDRKNKPFIAINCGAIPETLLESELFGYVKGAFSGASSSGRIGKFELANKGVIFLDEIGDIPLYLQVKLLRVLQERVVVRIGSNQLQHLDIRVIAATNKNLKELVKEGKFREDLYYRLNVIPIEVPPLRDREDDIDIITKGLLNKYNQIYNKYVHTIDDDVRNMMHKYSWPGNIRELENVVEFMVSLSNESGIVKRSMLPKSFVDAYQEEKDKNKFSFLENNEIRTLKDIEKQYITKVLEEYGYDTEGKKKAAKKLGIGLATLYRKLDDMKWLSFWEKV